MRIRPLHDWSLSPFDALRLQERMTRRLLVRPAPRRPRLVAGADCAFADGGREVVAVVVVLALPSLEVVEMKEGRAPTTFPYVPGLLSFREAPALLDSFARVESAPEVVLFDGQGIAHPRGLGLAAHLGLWLDLPTVGCAKSRLCGTARGDPGPARGSYRTLTLNGAPVGRVVRTRDRVKPLFVSPGHRMDIPGAMRLTLRTGGGYRLPEPTRIADREVGRLARGTPEDPGAAPRVPPNRGVEVRDARPGDGAAIGAVKVASWRAAYRGIVSDRRLDSLDPVETGRRCEGWISGEGRVQVAVIDGRVSGFASFAPSRDPDEAPGVFEIWAIYLAPERWGAGAGRALLEGVLDRIRAAGATAVTLWVFAENARARRFYEAAGFRPDGAEKPWRPEDENELEIRYRLPL